MNNVRRFGVPISVLAAMLFAVTAAWYLALALSLCGIPQFVGLRFFWTAVLGLGPFVCLALSSLLADAYIHSDRLKGRLLWFALVLGMSPWLWSAAGLWLRVN